MKPKIIIGIETLLPGGAESFVIRLANALLPHFDVYVVVLRGNLVDVRIEGTLSKAVNLIRINFPFDSIISKFDSFILKFNIDISIRNYLAVKFTNRFLAKTKFALLHTNQFKVDFIFCKANKKLRIAHLTTIHGDYLNFYESNKRRNVSIIGFERKAKTVLNQMNGIAYISDHQLNFFLSTLTLNHISSKTRKIYNGVDLALHVPALPASNNFVKKDFVFGMVARGVKEKGWEAAIKAFIQIYTPGLQLVLVGESPYLNNLRVLYQHPEIYFVGYATQPLSWINLFDVGLLPSTFASESLPTSIIEYLAMGKPVIASDKGEIRNMLERDGGRAGVVLEVVGNSIDQTKLAKAMSTLVVDEVLYESMATKAKQNAEAFTLQQSVNSYLDFYKYLTTTD